MSQWESRFFGLTPENKEQLCLEPLFLLTYYGGFSYTEAYNLPIAYKKWWIERISKEIQKSNSGEAPQGSRAAHHSTPETEALLGKHRTNTPSKLKRF